MNSRLVEKTVLVTGCNGFIGSHLCSHLIQNYHCRVIGIDSNISPRQLPQAPATGLNDDEFSFHKIDVSNTELLESFLRSQDKIDFIFHLAAMANPRTCKENFELAFRINVNGTMNIVKNSENSRHVFMSSAAVYGDPIKIPIPEEHPRRGKDPYAISKKIGEDICKCYSENYGYDSCIVRNFNTFGDGQIADYIIPTLIKNALYEKKLEIWNSLPIRDFMYIEDALDALVVIAVNGKTSEVYNLGSGAGIRIGELANMIRDIIDRNLTLIDLKKEIIGSGQLIADNTKLRMLGWRAKVGFYEGLSRTIEWFKVRKQVIIP